MMPNFHTETAPARRRQAHKTRQYQRKGLEVVRIPHCYVGACQGKGLVSLEVLEEIPQVLADQPAQQVEATCPLFRLPPSSAQ